FVAGTVTVLIIDGLELVNIENQQRKRKLVAACEIDFALQGIVKADTVASPCQGIGKRGGKRLLILQRIAQRADNGAEQRLDDAQLVFTEAHTVIENNFPEMVTLGDQAI